MASIARAAALRVPVTLWVLLLVCAIAHASTCSTCDNEPEDNELLQVREAGMSETKVEVNIKENISGTSSPDSLSFRVVPVNSIRPTFFKARPKKVVVTMFGAGTRAAVGATGQLRALNAMGLLKEVDEVITAWGGSLATSIFAYAKGKTKEELLGSETAESLGSLDMATIEKPPGGILGRAVSPLFYYLAWAIGLGVPPREGLEVALAGNWLCEFNLNGKLPNYTLTSLFTSPFGVRLCGDGFAKHQVWTTSKKRLQWIKERNPDLDVTDALTLNGNLKSINIVSTLFSPQGYKPNGTSFVTMRMGPDFCGSPYYADQQNVDYEPFNESAPRLKDVVVGGGLVETFACLSTKPPKSPFEQAGRRKGFTEAEMEDGGVFSLQKAIGMSNNDLGLLSVGTNSTAVKSLLAVVAFYGAGVREAGWPFDFPDYSEAFAKDPFLFQSTGNYWPVAGYAKASQGDIGEKSYYVGQGGSVEGAGLIEAIRGSADCVVALTSKQFPLEDPGDVDYCTVPSKFTDNPSLLILPVDEGGPPLGLVQAFYEYFGIAVSGELFEVSFDYSNNQIFDTSLLFSLFCDAQKLKKAGKPVMVYREYTTLKNQHWGIEAGKRVKIVFSWVEKTSNWEAQLPNETQQAINDGKFDSLGNKRGFPYLRSLNGTSLPPGLPPIGGDIAALTAGQANLYASLAEWSLRQNEDMLKTCMGVP